MRIVILIQCGQDYINENQVT